MSQVQGRSHAYIVGLVERFIGAKVLELSGQYWLGDQVARAVLGKGSWAVLALTCHVELFTQSHYQQSIEPEENLSPLFKDVFMYHWRKECQHAILDEIEWKREDAKLTPAQQELVRALMLKAHRWQYIVTGVQHPYFQRVLTGPVPILPGPPGLTSPPDGAR